MKKIIVLLLCFAMVAGVFVGCGEEKDSLAGKYCVGYAKIDVTPAESVAMGGYTALGEATRMSTGVLSKLYLTCVALTDEAGQTVLLLSSDVKGIKTPIANSIRNMISEGTGVPVENIAISATHSHSTPNVDSLYLEFMDNVVKVAQDAMADRAPATMEYAATQLEGMSYVRHYNTDTGIVMGSNFSPAGAGRPVSHTTEADKELRLVRYTREGKQPILMANWLGHANKASTTTTDYGKTNHLLLSADYPGFCRDYVEKNSDCLFVMYMGASGNLATNSRLNDEPDIESALEYGEILGKHILTTAENMTAGSTGSIKTKTTAMQLKFGATAEFSAMSSGSLGVIVTPGEMFDTTSMNIRAQSQYDTTFVLTLANGSYGYIPTEVCYTYTDCYEVRDSSFGMGDAEKLETLYIDLLKELHSGAAQ